MTKIEVINQIVKQTGVEKAAASRTIEAFFRVVQSSMIKGKNIYFRGFGSFILQKRKRKVARNISMNTPMIIDEHYTPRFKPSKEFVKVVKSKQIPV